MCSSDLEDLISLFQTQASKIPYLLHRFHNVGGAGILLEQKRKGRVSGGHVDVGREGMMKGKGEEWGKSTSTCPAFIRLSNKHEQTKKQITTNKVT